VELYSLKLILLDVINVKFVKIISSSRVTHDVIRIKIGKTRNVQLTYFPATAFSQVRLFLDTPFPPKINVFECKLMRLNPRFGFFSRAFVMHMSCH